MYCDTVKIQDLVAVGRFHSIFLHRTTLGYQLYTYCRALCLVEARKIPLNCIKPNTKSISVMNT